MGGMGTGMLSAAGMATLHAAGGSTFDRMWVQMMVRHHTGAVAMAKAKLGAGSLRRCIDGGGSSRPDTSSWLQQHQVMPAGRCW